MLDVILVLEEELAFIYAPAVKCLCVGSVASFGVGKSGKCGGDEYKLILRSAEYGGVEKKTRSD